jgi:hypothetical protein
MVGNLNWSENVLTVSIDKRVNGIGNARENVTYAC